MFNTANILEALKNYIRTHGGQSAANNIAEAVNDLNSIPQGSGGRIPEAPIDGKQYARKDAEWSEVQSSGGDIPNEVTNAIETHGMGWTDEEEVEGFDIQWDGNTEGHEGIPALIGGFYKVSDILDIMNPIDNLIGANYVVYTGDGPVEGTITAEDILTDDNKVFTVLALDDSLIAIALEDGYSGELNVPKGVWFANVPNYGYVSRLYKEASTQEVVHQIDQKYIPQSSGGAMVVKVTADPETLALSADKTFAEISEAFRAGVNVRADLYVGESYGGSTAPVAVGNASAYFGRVFIDEETSTVKYMLECWTDDGIDEWASGAL